MNINEIFGGIKVNASFKDRICVFYDDSGTGKTFLFTIIKEYCQFNNITCVSYNYDVKDVINLIPLNSSNVVILDNADLYMSKLLFNRILKSNALIFISLKSLRFIDETKVGLYRVIYSNESMIVKRY